MSQATYLHGYSSPEQERLVAQALHWREGLILRETHFEPGTRLLEVGCGVGAVLGVLGQAFPGLDLRGVDWEPKQVAFAQRYLANLGLRAKIQQADALALPQADASVDAAWMMWFLEHVRDPLLALAEARRVLRADGELTCIEVDYRTLELEPWTPALQALLDGFRQGMDATGRCDAGTRLEGWLKDAGFAAVAVLPCAFDYRGGALPRQVDYLLGFIESAIPALLELPGMASEAVLRQGAADFRAIAAVPTGRIRMTVHKAWARK